MPASHFRLHPDLAAYRASPDWTERDSRAEQETELAQRHQADGALPGYCACCRRETQFAFNPVAAGLPNWREELACSECRLISRMRFCFDYAFAAVPITPDSLLYVTEQATFGFAWIAKQCQGAIGSEYLADTEAEKREAIQGYLRGLLGDELAELRHESVTALSLGDRSVDAVLTFEVLEHVPDFEAALREFHRVLRPDGMLVLSVPFAVAHAASLLRARMRPDGSIEHLVEPEYHGDPVSDAGCLAFHTFAWDLLDRLRAVGFRDVGLIEGWSPARGYLGFVGAISARR